MRVACFAPVGEPSLMVRADESHADTVDGLIMLQTRLWIVLSLALGLLVGGFGGYQWGVQDAAEGFAEWKEIAVSQIVASEVGASMDPYITGSPEVGTYALKRNIQLLELFIGKEAFHKVESVFAWDLTLSYARLGRLADKLGKKEEASEEYFRALQASEKTGRQFKSVQDLLLFVDKLDTQYREAMQNRKLSDKQ
jgi:hypothetical protein